MLEDTAELKTEMTKFLEDQDYDIYAKIMEIDLQIQTKLEGLAKELKDIKIRVEKLGESHDK